MSAVGLSLLFFFFKQKSAYEMRISDWSSDVCSSDLATIRLVRRADRLNGHHQLAGMIQLAFCDAFRNLRKHLGSEMLAAQPMPFQTGPARCFLPFTGTSMHYCSCVNCIGPDCGPVWLPTARGAAATATASTSTSTAAASPTPAQTASADRTRTRL